MKTPKRQMPQRPRCPICGSELDGESTDIDDFHDVFYVYCPKDGEHIITGNGGNISDKDYKKLEEAYLRWRYADEWRVIENGEHAIHARWKRKNREAQLKRTIARLRRIERRKLRQDKLLKLYRERVYWLKWEIEDARRDIENESTAATAWEKDYYRLLHIAHGYCSASTCGQDIEGS